MVDDVGKGKCLILRIIYYYISIILFYLTKGLGPAVIARTINYYNGDRVKAFNIAVSMWIVCSVFLFCMIFTVVKDEQLMLAKIRSVKL